MRRARSRRPVRPRSRVAALLSTVLAAALAVGLMVGPPASADEPTVPAKRILTGWLPYWTNEASVTSFLANADLFTEISPFWHTAKYSAANGVSIGNYLPDGTRRALLARLKTAGVPIVPSITDGTAAKRMAKILADPQQRATHVQQIVDLVLAEGYDGIDLDYEKFAFSDGRATWATTRPLWVTFMTELGQALHAEGKLLTTAVPPPCDTAVRCGGTNGYWVYDIEGIAPAVDRIRIMAYDFSWSTPGPIGPYWWARGIAEYAASVIDPKKVQIGVPTYGRNWVRRDTGDQDGDGNKTEYLMTGKCPTNGTAAGTKEKAAYRTITTTTAPDAAEIPGLRAARGYPDIQWDDRHKEEWFRYTLTTTWTDDDGTSKRCTAYREVWYNDATAVLPRVRTVGDLGLGGAAFWTVGGEDPKQWDDLRAYAQGLAPATTSVDVSAPATASFGDPVTVTASVSAAKQPVGGATATLRWRAKAGGSWAKVASAATADDGTVTFDVTPKGSGSWRVTVAGSDVRKPGDSGAAASTTVRAKVTARLKAASVKAGTRFRVYGRVTPGQAGQPVRIQVLRSGTWRTTAVVKTDSRGLLAAALPSARTPGTYSYRLVSTATSKVAPGYSPTLELTTTG